MQKWYTILWKIFTIISCYTSCIIICTCSRDFQMLLSKHIWMRWTLNFVCSVFVVPFSPFFLYVLHGSYYKILMLLRVIYFVISLDLVSVLLFFNKINFIFNKCSGIWRGLEADLCHHLCYTWALLLLCSSIFSHLLHHGIITHSMIAWLEEWDVCLIVGIKTHIILNRCHCGNLIPIKYWIFIDVEGGEKC